jgi:rhomboid protease GluP
VEATKKINWDISYLSENGLIACSKFSMSSYGEEVTVQIESDRAAIKSKCLGNQIIDYGKNKRNVESFLATFIELKRAATDEELAKKYEEIKSTLVETDADILSQPPVTTREKIEDFFSIFIPREGYYITPILINLNIVIFILMAMSGAGIMLPESESLIKWGANFKPVTLDGEWWRLITSCFVHIGIIHLLMNMYALLYIGLLLEPYLGKTRFAVAYLLTGIVASITSLWWHDLTVSAGASGAIFGMYGVFLSLLTTDLIEKSARKALLTSIGVFVVYNLMNGMKAGVDNAAHVGGLLSGLVIGFAYLPSLKRPNSYNLKKWSVATVAVLILLSSFIAYGKIPNDVGKWQKKLQEFTVMEERALQVYHTPNNTPSSLSISLLKDTGIYYWNKNIELIKEADKLNVPAELHSRDKKLLHYCKLRIKSYELLYKSFVESTGNYKNELDTCNKEIEEAINNIK